MNRGGLALPLPSFKRLTDAFKGMFKSKTVPITTPKISPAALTAPVKKKPGIASLLTKGAFALATPAVTGLITDVVSRRSEERAAERERLAEERAAERERLADERRAEREEKALIAAEEREERRAENERRRQEQLARFGLDLERERMSDTEARAARQAAQLGSIVEREGDLSLADIRNAAARQVNTWRSNYPMAFQQDPQLASQLQSKVAGVLAALEGATDPLWRGARLREIEASLLDRQQHSHAPSSGRELAGPRGKGRRDRYAGRPRSRFGGGIRGVMRA